MLRVHGYLCVGSLGGCHKWEHHCHTYMWCYDELPPFSRLYKPEIRCCFRTALKYFPAFSKVLYTPPASSKTAHGLYAVCALSWDVPVPVASDTDNSQGKSAPVHGGGFKHGGYVLPAAPGASASHWLGFRCCHFPKKVKLNHPWAHILPLTQGCSQGGYLAGTALFQLGGRFLLCWKVSPSLSTPLHKADCSRARSVQDTGTAPSKEPSTYSLNCILGSRGGYCTQLQRVGRSRRKRLPGLPSSGSQYQPRWTRWNWPETAEA